MHDFQYFKILNQSKWMSDKSEAKSNPNPKNKDHFMFY